MRVGQNNNHAQRLGGAPYSRVSGTNGGVAAAAAEATKCWSLVRSNGACPTARSGHSAVVVKKNLYIFGGCGHPIAAAAAAAAASGAAATTTSRENAATGGGVQAAAAAAGDSSDSDDTMPVCLGDLHVYDLARQSWSEIRSSPTHRSRGGRLELDADEGVSPAERTCAAMCASEDETRLFLSGGAGDDPDDLRADLLEFNVRRRTWRLLFDGGSSRSCVSESACRRIGHAMVHDAARNRLVVFGGSTGEFCVKIAGDGSMMPFTSPLLRSLTLPNI